MGRRIIDVYYDQERRLLLDSEGNTTSVVPYLTYKEQAIMRLRVLTADGSSYDGFAADDVFSAAIDDDFGDSADLMVKTLAAGINVAGDWVSGGTADPTAGEFSVRLDAFTAGFSTKIAASEVLTATKFELQAVPAGETYLSAVLRFPLYCMGLIDDAGAVPPEPEEDYYTKTQVDALVADKVDKVGSDDIEITDATKGVIFKVGSSRHRLTLTTDGGQVTFTISDAL